MVERKILPRLSRKMFESSFFFDLSFPSSPSLDCCFESSELLDELAFDDGASAAEGAAVAAAEKDLAHVRWIEACEVRTRSDNGMAAENIPSKPNGWTLCIIVIGLEHGTSRAAEWRTELDRARMLPASRVRSSGRDDGCGVELHCRCHWWRRAMELDARRIIVEQ